jgi:hypothetical protein
LEWFLKDSNNSHSIYEVKMSNSDAENEDQISPPEAVEFTLKKPYEKPELRYERVFETMALSCGKTGPTNFACRTNRNAS